MNLYFVPADKVVMKDDTRCQTLKFLLTAKVHELQRLESAVKKQIHNMHFQPIPKYNIAASLYKALQHIMELKPQKATKYLNLHINILQIYVLEQQVQSTSYSHHVHLSCNEKLKS